MGPLQKFEYSTRLKMIGALFLIATSVFGRLFLSQAILLVGLIVIAVVLFSSRIVRYGRLAKTFILLGLASYTMPALTAVRLYFSNHSEECRNSGPVLCTNQVAEQLSTLTFYISLVLAVQVLASISIAEWLYLAVQTRDEQGHGGKLIDLLEDLVKTAATAIHDFENVARSRLNAVATLQHSYKRARGVSPGIGTALRVRWEDRASMQNARVETFGATGLELFSSLTTASIMAVRKDLFESPTHVFSRYQVNTLLSFYESYSMSSHIHGDWQELLDRVVNVGALVADVGSGNGRLLYKLNSLKAKTTAYEPDGTFKTSLERVVSRVGSNAVAIISEFFAGGRPDGPFDVVILMNNVLVEMIGDRDPSEAFASLARTLKPSGVLVFDYPDRSALDEIGCVEKLTSSHSARLRGQLLVRCTSSLDQTVDAGCNFSFDCKDDVGPTRTEGLLEWRELVHWYPHAALETMLDQCGMMIKSRKSIDVRTVIPAEMFLYECVHRGAA